MEEWLEAVSTARIPCAVVSSLDRRNMVEALERMGIHKYFQVPACFCYDSCTTAVKTGTVMMFLGFCVASLDVTIISFIRNQFSLKPVTASDKSTIV